MKHVVFGTGPIGTALADILAGQGHKVVAVNRSGTAGTGDGVEVIAGDATDSAFTSSVAEGAAVVYQCLNPPYTKWPQLFPPLQAGVFDAAAATGAKLVALENLYMYGPTDGAPLTEELPYAATGSKGAVRARMAQDLLDAHRSGILRTAIGRASDYFGPGGLMSAMGERVFYPAVAGKKAQVMGDPDQPHSYSFIPDIAAGLAALGSDDRADGRAWHLPNAPATTTREFITKVFKAAGTAPGVSVMPPLMMNVVGLFNGTVRELKEMMYGYKEPFVVDSSDYESTFGHSATAHEEAIATTVEWYRANPRGR
ncbi:MAG: NAD-dependent epimerase/dehydratase family protein [Acidimicrobiia bacterium]|nr:NAD-dependent epimerase/dehydratase family protein [Acidimicrobiia bacterium]